MSAHFDRALLLFDQGRVDLAEQELKQILGAEPDDPSAQALLAMCFSRRKEHARAVATAERAVGLAPDLAFCHYALASALHMADRENEAALAIEQAIMLDPLNPGFHGVYASIHFARRDWSAALAAADAGLALDAENDVCTNFRAMALVQLGRRAEAGAAIEGALERDPENALNHANQGWTLLHDRKPAKALEHFREALRIDPSQDWARAGLVEALKARHLIYRVMLSFFLWTGRLGRRAQWLLVFGILFGQQVLSRLAQAIPALAPLTGPILNVLFVFVLLTWLADPLFNLILRLNRFGRLALTRQQIVASNWLAACLLITLGVLLTGLLLPLDTLVYASLPGLALSAATAGVFRVQWGWPRLLLAAWVVGLAALTIRVFYLVLLIDHLLPPHEGNNLVPDFRSDLNLLVIGLLAYTLVANALAMSRPQRWSAS